MLASALACSAKLESDGLGGTGKAPVEPERAATAPASDAGAASTTLEPPPAPIAGSADSGVASGEQDAGAPSSPDLPPPAPPGGPGSNQPAATPAPPSPEPHCGLPPYQAVHVSAHDIMTPAAKNDLAGVSVTFKHCPDQSFDLPPGGLTVMITTEVETWVRFAAPGYLPWLEGEVAVPSRPVPLAIEATMLPLAIAQTLVPNWKAESAMIYVEVRRGQAVQDEPCRSPAGVTLTVKDHPEALVRYRGKGANAGYDSMIPTTSDEGIALITNLWPPVLTTVELVADKPECTYVPAYGDANSPALLPILRTPLQGGSITHQVFNPAR